MASAAISTPTATIATASAGVAAAMPAVAKPAVMPVVAVIRSGGTPNAGGAAAAVAITAVAPRFAPPRSVVRPEDRRQNGNQNADHKDAKQDLHNQGHRKLPSDGFPQSW
jgi:hypothetical protein